MAIHIAHRAARRALDWYAHRGWVPPEEPAGFPLSFLVLEIGKFPTPSEIEAFEVAYGLGRLATEDRPHGLEIETADGLTVLWFPNRGAAANAFGDEARRRAARGGSYALRIVLLAIVALLALGGCGPQRWVNRPVSYDPGLELAATAAKAWNEACGSPPLFRPGEGEIRFLWVDTLGGEGRVVRGGAAILVARDEWFSGTDRTGQRFDDVDKISFLAHELGHRLISGHQGADGFGHFAEEGAIMSRLNGADLPTAKDIRLLRSLGYACEGGLE